MNLAFAVRDRRLTRKGLEPLAADTAGHITFTVDFDAEWTGMVKVVVFENGESRAEVLYTGQAEIPAAVLGAGELYVSVNGYRSQGDTVAIVRTVAMARPVVILPAGAAPAGDPTAYTPTLFEQILAAAGEAGTAAAEAQAVKNQLLADKAAGLFTGETGPAGESATIAVDGAEAGEEAAVYNLGTERNARLRFVLPRGRGIAEIVDNWDGTWTVAFSSGETQTLRAPGTLGNPGDAVLASAVADYLTAHPPAAGEDGRGVTAIAYTSDGNQWIFTFSDGQSQAVAGPAIPAISTSLNSTSASTAASSSAVRMAYNLAATAMQRSGGTFTGKVTAAASSQLPTQYLLRNTRLSATALTPSNNGEICWVYG